MTKNLPETFCPLPFNTMVTDVMGRTGSCPYSSGFMHLNDMKIEDRWQAPEFQALRADHLQGRIAETCKRCYLEERSGQESLRKFAEQKNADFTNYESGPRTIVFRLSNICNLACRTCQAVDTSMYNREGLYYSEHYGLKDNLYIDKDPRRQFKEEDLIIGAKFSENLREIHFYGGEPLLNKSHYTMLDSIIEADRAKDIFLLYCTNGTNPPKEELLARWEKFSAIIMNFSIDGIEEYYEYLRWPAKWSSITEHLAWHHSPEMVNRFGSKILRRCTITVGVHNIFNLPEIFDYLQNEFGEDGINFSVVHRPSYYSIRILPPEVKRVVSQRIRESKHAEKLEFLVNFMMDNTESEHRWHEFVEWTERKDIYRGQSFAECFPEYFTYLAPHFSNFDRNSAHWKSILPPQKRPEPELPHNNF